MDLTAAQPQSKPDMRPRVDFDKSPYLVLWELTRSCTLACQHCRAKAMRKRNPSELSTDEAFKLLGEIEEFGRPLLVLTGGDPLQRPDLFEIIAEARRRGFTVAITPSGTPLMTRSIVQRLKESGVERLAISIDGPDRQTHDTFRRVPGSFDLSMNIVNWAREFDLPLQINTTICRHNVSRFEDMASMVETFNAALWSVFFLVPTGRATQNMQISPEEAEIVLKKMARLAATAGFDVKSTAAPHFRRVLIEFVSSAEEGSPLELHRLGPGLRLGALRSYQSVNDGKGIMFISDTGDIYPSGFLPLSAGNVKNDNVVSVYREHDLFKALRNPALLKGKCGSCRYKVICGGSRARAYGEFGDYLAEDSLCSWIEPEGQG